MDRLLGRGCSPVIWWSVFSLYRQNLMYTFQSVSSSHQLSCSAVLVLSTEILIVSTWSTAVPVTFLFCYVLPFETGLREASDPASPVLGFHGGSPTLRRASDHLTTGAWLFLHSQPTLLWDSLSSPDWPQAYNLPSYNLIEKTGVPRVQARPPFISSSFY